MVFNQQIIPSLIFFFILVTFLLDIVLILWGEILSWSLTGVTIISSHLPAWLITRTGRLLHSAKKRVNRLPALVDNPHVMLFNFLVVKT